MLLVAAPFQRYLIGTLLVDTGGSTLAAGLMHASINAAGAMVIVPGGWQMVPALILLTLAVVGIPQLARVVADRRLRPRHHTGLRSRRTNNTGRDTVTTMITAPVQAVPTNPRAATTALLRWVPSLLHRQVNNPPTPDSSASVSTEDSEKEQK